MSVQCSPQQKVLLETAAEKSGTDVSTLLLTYGLRGIGALGNGHADGDTPLIVPGKVGAVLRERAARQGIPPDRMLELLLVPGDG